MPGSSPRVRGTYPLVRTTSEPLRFIPTSAGNITNRFGVLQLQAVHPHECGEHATNRHIARCDRRFIPTSAGNIEQQSCSLVDLPVHPHECGEHRYRGIGVVIDHGSSPRVRGTCLILSLSLRLRRFIPTSAGNIIHCSSSTSTKKVHPHECGEHAYKLYDQWIERRFIPTSAGNIRSSRHAMTLGAVHPHECGEH